METGPRHGLKDETMPKPDGLSAANLPKTNAAIELGDAELLALTGDEYGFVAVLGQAAAKLEEDQRADLSLSERVALKFAARACFALFADVEL
jgi:hypothetical protein